MIRQYLFLILIVILTVVLIGPFFTKAMSNAIDMQIKMQLQQVETLQNGN